MASMTAFVWYLSAIGTLDCCSHPKCAACEYGYAHCKPVTVVTTAQSSEKEGVVESSD